MITMHPDRDFHRDPQDFHRDYHLYLYLSAVHLYPFLLKQLCNHLRTSYPIPMFDSPILSSFFRFETLQKCEREQRLDFFRALWRAYEPEVSDYEEKQLAVQSVLESETGIPRVLVGLVLAYSFFKKPPTAEIEIVSPNDCCVVQ